MPKTPLQSITTLAMTLALGVVMLGAYTRLTDAGLGCPDWPGCYGQLMVPQGTSDLIDGQKAWTEMAHRYVAGTLGLLILLLNVLVAKHRWNGIPVPWKLPLGLVFLVFFQAALGMWTVTLKLWPVVVMGHLLGGLLIFGGLCYFRMQLSEVRDSLGGGWRFWTTLGVVLILCQIALGGWVSANYAGLACIGFPTCHGLWWPSLDFSHGFHLFSPVGDNYQGGVLEHQARMTIQWVHRLGALVVLLFVLCLSFSQLACCKEHLVRRGAWLAVFLVLTQCALGIANVVYLLPLWAALLHNGVAALLLATMLWMHYLGGPACKSALN